MFQSQVHNHVFPQPYSNPWKKNLKISEANRTIFNFNYMENRILSKKKTLIKNKQEISGINMRRDSRKHENKNHKKPNQ